jgi:hypothetical protein
MMSVTPHEPQPAGPSSRPFASRQAQGAGAAKHRLPLRVPPPRANPVLEQIDAELFWHRRTFMDALGAAKHWRTQSTIPGRQAFHSHQLTTMKYKRQEIARLLEIRRRLDDRGDGDQLR